ncbi:unnamed protein product [Albugo candida]|uniref:FYVE-type domain-containing protein n=1 Tax=Albugo candida TaxID=65357 RepID=A0A024GLM1_9STRA|nr:unnamed protein product [Albugo candida]|eukprot:CCI47630.1 unnamed protein product [Albugo candida]
MASAANTNIRRRKSRPEPLNIPATIRAGHVPEESTTNSANVPSPNGTVTPLVLKSFEKATTPSTKARNTFDFGSLPQISHAKFRLNRSRSVDKGSVDVVSTGDSTQTIEQEDTNKLSPVGTGDVRCTGHSKVYTQQTHNVPISPDKMAAGRDDAHQQASALRGKSCASCDRSFSVFRAKHTCKVCQERFCDDCSKNRFKLDLPFERKKGSRICDACARSVCAPLHKENLCTQGDHVTTEEKSNGAHGINYQAHGADAVLGRNYNDYVVRDGSQKFWDVFHRDDSLSHLRPRHWRYFFATSLFILLRQLMGTLSHCREDSSCAHFVHFYAQIEKILADVASFQAVGLSFMFLVLFDEFCRMYGTRDARPARTTIYSRTVANVGTKSMIQNDIHSSILPDEETDPIVQIETQEASRDGFDFDRLLHVLQQGGSNPEMTVEAFLSACGSLCEFIMVFGRATSFAASTVHGYIHSIESNLSNWSKDCADGTQCHWNKKSLKSIIEHEVETNTATIGGKKKPSCSRCILRLLWFIEFVEACIRYMFIEMAHESCSSAISKAYEETIGSRHPWIIRKGVFSALSAIPSRQNILNSLGLGTQSEGMALSLIEQTQNALKCMLEHVHAMLQTHELLDLK